MWPLELCSSFLSCGGNLLRPALSPPHTYRPLGPVPVSHPTHRHAAARPFPGRTCLEWPGHRLPTGSSGPSAQMRQVVPSPLDKQGVPDEVTSRQLGTRPPLWARSPLFQGPVLLLMAGGGGEVISGPSQWVPGSLSGLRHCPLSLESRTAPSRHLGRGKGQAWSLDILCDSLLPSQTARQS